MLDLDCPAELPDSLSTGKFLFPFYFPRLSLEGKSPRAAHHSELCFTSLKEDIEYLYKLLGIFLHRRFVSSPHLFIAIDFFLQLLSIMYSVNRYLLSAFYVQGINNTYLLSNILLSSETAFLKMGKSDFLPCL